MRHPWYTALVLLVVGAISFFLANVIPALDTNRNNHWAGSTHWEFIVALIAWLIVPALCLLGILVCAFYGCFTRSWHRSPSANHPANRGL